MDDRESAELVENELPPAGREDDADELNGEVDSTTRSSPTTAAAGATKPEEDASAPKAPPQNTSSIVTYPVVYSTPRGGVQLGQGTLETQGQHNGGTVTGGENGSANGRHQLPSGNVAVGSVGTGRVAEREGTVRIVFTPPSEGGENAPMHAKDLKPLIGFSILAVIMFFPTGIAALILAIQTRKEFLKGLTTGQFQVARKKYKICERLVIFSVIGGLIFWVIVLAVVEKHLMGGKADYYKLHANNGVLIHG